MLFQVERGATGRKQRCLTNNIFKMGFNSALLCSDDKTRPGAGGGHSQVLHIEFSKVGSLDDIRRQVSGPGQQ